MKTTLFVFSALAAAAVGAASASAQDLVRGETVLTRPRPEVEQLGIRAGGFRVLPRMEIGGSYDSNVFATDTNTKDDFITVIKPELAVRSDWNNHALNLTANADFGRYSQYKTQDYNDFATALNGRVDVLRDVQVGAEVFFRREHEGAGDADLIGTFTRPVVYYVSGGEASYTHRFGRFRARLSGTGAYYNYESALGPSGLSVSQDYRDRWDTTGALRVGYELSPGYEAFIQGGLVSSHYNHIPTGAPSRDSDGYETVAGAAFDLTGFLTGEVFAGYMTRTYDSNVYKDFSGLTMGGQLNWSVTQLTTVTGRASRQVRDTLAFQGGRVASSYTRTLVALGVDHELLRSLLLNARAQYRTDDYNGIDRTDDVYTLGAGATYQVNRYLYLTGGYTYEERSSNEVNDYKDNLIYLRVGAQL